MAETKTNQTQESGTELSIQIMEATGRFEYVGEQGILLKF